MGQFIKGMHRCFQTRNCNFINLLCHFANIFVLDVDSDLQWTKLWIHIQAELLQCFTSALHKQLLVKVSQLLKT